MKQGLLWLILLSFTIIPSFGSTVAAAETDTILMDEIVITATRYEEDAESIPANVTIISEADIINAPAYDIPDLLRTQAGVHVNDITGNRRSYTVDIRGFGETAGLNTLVLVDGRRINAPDLSGTDWSLIPLDRVARIEVVRGARSAVMYGDNAAGGVINIITKRGRALHAGAEITGGSHSLFGADAYTSGRLEDVSFRISGSYLTADGYRDNSDTDAKGFGASLGYHPGDTVRFTLSAGYRDDQTRLPGALMASELAGGLSRTATTQPNDFADVEDYYLKGGAEIQLTDGSRLKIDGSYRSRASSSYATFAGGWYSGKTEIESVAAAPQLIIRDTLFGLPNHLILGVDYVDNEEDITNLSEFFGFGTETVLSLEKKNLGYFIHDEFRPTDQTALSVGYRYDRAEFIFPDISDERILDEELFTAGITYQPKDSLDIYGSFSRSFRYPVLDELFNFFTSTVDPGLSPQMSIDYEAGIRYRHGDALSVGMSLFQIDTDDELFYNPVAFTNQNLDGTTRRKGVELMLKGEIDRFGFSIGYAYTDSEIQDGPFSGNAVPNVPKNMVTLHGEYDFPMGLTVSLNGIHVGGRGFISDFDNTYPDQEDYVVFNGKATYNWDRFKAFIDLNNLTDETYAEYGAIGGFPAEQAYFPSPGFNVRAGMSITL